MSLGLGEDVGEGEVGFLEDGLFVDVCEGVAGGGELVELIDLFEAFGLSLLSEHRT